MTTDSLEMISFPGIFSEKWLYEYSNDNYDLSNPTVSHVARIINLIKSIANSVFPPQEEVTKTFFNILDKYSFFSIENYNSFPQQFDILNYSIEKGTNPFFISELLKATSAIQGFHWFLNALIIDDNELFTQLLKDGAAYLTPKNFKAFIRVAANGGAVNCIGQVIMLARENLSADEFKKCLGYQLILSAQKQRVENACEIVKLLIEAVGLDPRLCDRKGFNAFHLACRDGTPEIVTCMIEKGNSSELINAFSLPTKYDHITLNPLMLACKNGRYGKEIVSILLDNGATIINFNSSKTGVSLLNLAISSKYNTFAKKIVEEDKNWIHEAPEHGLTPFVAACKSGNDEMAAWLLGKGATVTYDYPWKTSIEVAAANGFPAIAKILIGIDRSCIDQQCPEDPPLLELALSRDNEEVALILIEGGASFDNVNYFYIACKMGHIRVVKKMLLWNKNLINLEDEDHLTPLHYAIKQRRETLAMELIELGARVDCTHLFDACRVGLEKVVHNIFHKKPDLMKKELNQSSAYLTSAISSESSKDAAEAIANFLIAQGAEPSLDDLALACSKGLTSVVLKIVEKPHIKENLSLFLENVIATQPTLLLETPQAITRLIFAAAKIIPHELSLPVEEYNPKTSLSLSVYNFKMKVDREILERSPHYSIMLKGPFKDRHFTSMDIPFQVIEDEAISSCDADEILENYFYYLYTRQPEITHDNFWGLYKMAIYFNDEALIKSVMNWAEQRPECLDYPFELHEGTKRKCEEMGDERPFKLVNTGKEEEQG